MKCKKDYCTAPAAIEASFWLVLYATSGLVLETLFIYYSDDGHLEALGSLLKQFVPIVPFGAQ